MTKYQQAKIDRIIFSIGRGYVDGTLKSSVTDLDHGDVQLSLTNAEGLQWFEQHFFFTAIITKRGRVAHQGGDFRY